MGENIEFVPRGEIQQSSCECGIQEVKIKFKQKSHLLQRMSRTECDNKKEMDTDRKKEEEEEKGQKDINVILN